MSFRSCIALLLAFSSAGCVTLQDTEYRMAQRCRAQHAWCFGCDERCNTNPMSHYACGWRKGYLDVLMGGDGECPPVPPQCYWSHKYQSEMGECAIENWFLGYSHGAAQALAKCGNRFHHVPISNTFRECSPGCLPTDYSPYNFGRTGLGIKQSSSQSSAAMDSEEDSTSPSIPKAPPSAASESPSPENSDPGETSPAPVDPSPGVSPTVPPTPDITPKSSDLPDNETTTGIFSPANKWTQSVSMSKTFSHSVIAKLTGNAEKN